MTPMDTLKVLLQSGRIFIGMKDNPEFKVDMTEEVIDLIKQIEQEENKKNKI